MPIDFAKGQPVSIASRKLKKVAGNLPGLLGLNKGNINKDSSDTAALNERSQNAPKLFQFPLDVTGDPGIGNHGHYIIFFVNEQQGSTLSFADELKSGNDLIKKEKSDRKIPNFINKEFGGGKYKKTKNTEGVTSQLIDTGSSASAGYVGGTNFEKLSGLSAEGMGVPVGKTASKAEESPQISGLNVQIKRPATKRLDTAIALYMPAQTQVTYGAKYIDAEISGLAAAAGQGYDYIKSAMGGANFSLEGLAKRVQGDIATDIEKRILLKVLSGLDAVGITGAREAVEITAGEVIADRMELAFKGVDRRIFQYTFKMIPRNSREAEEIRKIVFAFKANMLPEMIDGMDRDTMNVPNTFNIQYMYKGKENDYIHRVSECFLENVQVTYGGDRYKTFEPHDASDGAPPVETQITLAFKEIEMITREKIFEGF